MISHINIFAFQTHALRNHCHAFSACWFWFDVELEVQARSRADAVRVPAARMVVMVIVMDPPLMMVGGAFI